MAYEELRDDIDNLQNNTKEFVSSTVKYYKLLGFKIMTRSITLLAKFILVAFCVAMLILFSSLALAIWLGYLLDNYLFGFLIVAGVYLLIALIVFFVKSSLIERCILRKFSDIFFNE